ncbi:MAG: sugar transferase [Elusimicrobia bacterium]|nr:sugar transferase [Elusimicrobiota bacterium]
MLIFRWRRILLFLGDLALFYVALGLALIVRHFALITPEFYLHNVKVFSLLVPIWAGVFYVVGLYDIRRVNKLTNLINYTLLALVASSSVSVAVLYLFSLQIGTSPKINFMVAFILMHALAMLWRRIWTRFLLAKVLAQRVAFLGSNPLIEEIRRDLENNPHLGFSVAPLPELAARRNEGGLPALGRRAGGGAFSVDVLVVNSSDAANSSLFESLVVSTAVAEDIPVISHLDFYEDLYGKIPPEHAAESGWLFRNVLSRDKNVYLLVKRAIDICVSAAGLIGGFPFFAAVYAALKIADGKRHPALYFQKRVGYLGRKFVIWKFRTMVPGADKAGPLYKAMQGDSRITALGKFLRRTRLDELPQLWNVFKGDMSLVGPRPEWTQEVRLLEQGVPHYHLRHLVKPGLTGWAQINFRATSNEQESVEKLRYDLYYVKNISLALDIGIILRTLRRVFQKDASFTVKKSAEVK